MTASTIARYRLDSQQISQLDFTRPAELVSWFGAMQAQDYKAVKWAMGLRLPNATDATVEQAIADKSVVRTWALRGTLHVIAADDVGWILTLIRSRFQKVYVTHYRKLGLTDAMLTEGKAAISRTLQGGRQLTRPELKIALERDGVHTHDQRLNHLLVWSAIDGLICCGCQRGKEFTYTLLPEWISTPETVAREDALSELTRRYFTSHGPATLADFVWWSGLTIADAKAGLERVKSGLLQETINGQLYWMGPLLNAPDYAAPSVHLLPSFDEYLIAYKDRRAALGTLNLSQIVNAGNGLFKPVVVVDGQVVGTWKRTIKKDQILVETDYFLPLSDMQHEAVNREIARYRKFMGVTA